MTYLKRKVDSFLYNWKRDSNHKPLIVKGPRQVGKTESIMNFGKLSYNNIIYINFVEEPKYKLIIADGYKADDIILNISRIDPSKQFIAGKTLIVFDELQEFPEIATALKFFAIDGRFDVICSGSMLGINYKRIDSNSVGYKTDYEMFSMEGVFAGGDSVTGPSSAVNAIAQGKVAAANIDNYLGYNHEIACDVDIPDADLEDKNPCGRSELTSRYPDERNRDFDGFENGLLLEEAIQEAGRCLRCDRNSLGAFRGGRQVKW